MSHIKKILIALLLLSATAFGGLTRDNPPLNLYTQGSSTAAGVTATLVVPGADGYNIVLNGTNVATSTITVAIQVFDSQAGAYVTPATIGLNSVANPITLTNATSQIINIPGGFEGVQVNVTSFGTATGTFDCTITAY